MPASSRPGAGQVARERRAGGDDERVVTTAQVVGGDVDTDVDAGAELHALGAHLLEAAVEVVLLHLELGDAVAQQATDAVVTLVDLDGVTGARELLRDREAGRAGTDDADRLAGRRGSAAAARPSPRPRRGR